MTSLLNKTLRKIEEEANRFDECFVLVDQLLKEYGEKDLANRLYSDIEETVPWETVANLFGILIWSTSDNGHELIKEMEKWLLNGDNPRKILIALNLDVYPFYESTKMEAVLERIKTRHPSLVEECDKLMSSRKKVNA